MLGTVAAAALPSMTNSGTIAPSAGPSNAQSDGGVVGPVTVNTGGGGNRAPGWVWPVAGALVVVVLGVVWLKK